MAGCFCDLFVYFAEQSTPKAAEKIPCEKANDTVYIIFDNVEQSRGWTGGTLLLGALFKLSELTRLPNLGLVFISSVGLDGYQASTLSREPLSLYFRDYNDSELYRILLLQRPNVDLYASFLRCDSLSVADVDTFKIYVFCVLSRC